MTKFGLGSIGTPGTPGRRTGSGDVAAPATSTDYVTQDSGPSLIEVGANNAYEGSVGAVVSAYVNVYEDFDEYGILDGGSREFMAERIAIIDWIACIGPNNTWSGTPGHKAATKIAEEFMPAFRAEFLCRLGQIRGDGAREITEIVASPAVIQSMASAGLIEPDGSSRFLHQPAYSYHPDFYNKYEYPKDQDAIFKLASFLYDLGLRLGVPSHCDDDWKHVPRLVVSESCKTRFRPASSEARQAAIRLRGKTMSQRGTAEMHADTDRHADWYNKLVDGVEAMHKDPDRHADWHNKLVDGLEAMHKDPDRRADWHNKLVDGLEAMHKDPDRREDWRQKQTESHDDIKFPLSGGRFLLVRSQREAAEVIGGLHHATVGDFAKGKRQNGVVLTKAEKAEGLSGTYLEGVHVESYERGSSLVGDSNNLGYMSVTEAREVLVADGFGLKSKSKGGSKRSGRGGFRNSDAWKEKAKAQGLSTKLSGESVVYLDEDLEDNEARAIFDSQDEAGRFSHKEGKASLVRNAISNSFDGRIGKSATSKHEDLRAVKLSDLDRKVGTERAARIRRQIEQDVARLRSREHLSSYEKGTQASKDRKKSRK